MHRQPPRRLRHFEYLGFLRYFLTFCTHQRRCHFAKREVVYSVRAQILQQADICNFIVVAYCFMPDHLHLLVEGASEVADGRRFIVRAKQASGYACREMCEGRLWQRYGYERILRSTDATLAVAKYILENPVRAGLVTRAEDYEFSGSMVYPLEEILSAANAWSEGASG